MTTEGHKKEFTASANYLVLPIQNGGAKGKMARSRRPKRVSAIEPFRSSSRSRGRGIQDVVNFGVVYGKVYEVVTTPPRQLFRELRRELYRP